MINAQNYFEKSSVITDRMPSAVKEAHDLAVSLQQDGINPFETGDKDIDETMQLLLNEANKIVSSTSQPTKVSVYETPKQPSKPRTKSTQKTNQAGTKSASKKVAFKKVKSNTSARVPKPKTETQKTNPAKSVIRTIQKRTTHKANKKAASNKVKTVIVKVKEPKAPVTVKKLSLELQTIKAFIGMDGKTYKRQAITNKQKAVKNALDSGKIVDHKTVITDINHRLGNAIDAIDKASATDIKVTLEKDFVNKCKQIVAGAKVRIRTEFLSGVKSNGSKNYIVNYGSGQNPLNITANSKSEAIKEAISILRPVYGSIPKKHFKAEVEKKAKHNR